MTPERRRLASRGSGGEMATMMTPVHWIARLKAGCKREEGQTVVEYMMVLVPVALTAFLMTPGIKSAILAVFSKTSSALA